MKKFVVLYHAPPSFNEKMMSMKPEDMEKEMKAWGDWIVAHKENVVDFGTPLSNGKTVSKSGSKASTKEVSGYSILRAETFEDVLDVLKDHPHLLMDDSCSIEVHEVMPLPGNK